MLDIEIEQGPEKTALDVVSVNEMARHIRITPTLAAKPQWTGLLTDAITDAVGKIHGFSGELNRTILPTTYRRFLTGFPGKDEGGKPKPILIPFGPLLSFDGIYIEDGSSPPNKLAENTYVVKKGETMLVPEVHPVSAWPQLASGPRAVSIVYRCGYDAFPPIVKRMVKFMGAHFLENSEATILEQNKTLIDRNVLFAILDLRSQLKIPNGYDDWNE